jgi:hypothetical protein
MDGPIQTKPGQAGQKNNLLYLVVLIIFPFLSFPVILLILLLGLRIVRVA